MVGRVQIPIERNRSSMHGSILCGLSVVVLAGAVFWGCAAARGPLFEAKIALAGKAVVYVYRTDEDYFKGGSIRNDIWINERNVGALRSAGYVAQEVDPGPLHIEEGKPPSAGQQALQVCGFLVMGIVPAVILGPGVISDAHHWDGHDASFTAAAGQTYFVKHSWKSGLVTQIPQLTLVQQEVGAAEIRECRYSQ